MESLTRRSLLKTPTLALAAVFLHESSAVVSKVSDTLGRVDPNLNENTTIELSPNLSLAIDAEPSSDPSQRLLRQHLAVMGAPSNLGLKPPSPGKEPGVRYMAQVLREHEPGLAITRGRCWNRHTAKVWIDNRSVDEDTKCGSDPRIQYSTCWSCWLLTRRRTISSCTWRRLQHPFGKRLSASQAGTVRTSLYRRT